MVKQVILSVGDQAPRIKTADVLGAPVDTRDTTHRFVLLAFMRFADCPWCNLAIHRLAMEYPTFLDNGCQIVAFMKSPADSITANIHDRHAVRPKFPIVADEAGKFYAQYGVKSSPAAIIRSITKIPAWVHAVKDHGFSQHSIKGDKFVVPAYFLVDTRSGQIVSADYGKSFYDHDTFVKLYEDIFFHAY